MGGMGTGKFSTGSKTGKKLVSGINQTLVFQQILVRTVGTRPALKS